MLTQSFQNVMLNDNVSRNFFSGSVKIVPVEILVYTIMSRLRRLSNNTNVQKAQGG